MQTIYKFPLRITDLQTISYPAQEKGHGEPLSAQFQNGQLVLWMLVEPGEFTRTLDIEILGTGNPIPELPPDTDRYYISTAHDPNTPLVWHVFGRI